MGAPALICGSGDLPGPCSQAGAVDGGLCIRTDSAREIRAPTDPVNPSRDTGERSAQEVTPCVDSAPRGFIPSPDGTALFLSSLKLQVPFSSQATDRHSALSPSVPFLPQPAFPIRPRGNGVPAEGDRTQCIRATVTTCGDPGRRVTGPPRRSALGVADDSVAASLIPRRGEPVHDERMKDVSCSGSRPKTGGCGRRREKGSAAERARERRVRGPEGCWAGWGGAGAQGVPWGARSPLGEPRAASRPARHSSPCVGQGLGLAGARSLAPGPAGSALGPAAPGGPGGQGAGGPGARADALLSDN